MTFSYTSLGLLFALMIWAYIWTRLPRGAKPETKQEKLSAHMRRLVQNDAQLMNDLAAYFYTWHNQEDAQLKLAWVPRQQGPVLRILFPENGNAKTPFPTGSKRKVRIRLEKRLRKKLERTKFRASLLPLGTCLDEDISLVIFEFPKKMASAHASLEAVVRLAPILESATKNS